MKQTRLWLATIAALLCSLTASAHDFSVGGIYYKITSSTDLTVAVTYRGSYSNSYSNEYSGAVTIPSTVTYNSKTYSVTSIGNDAFDSCESLTSITIPEGVTSIGSYAFEDCDRLTSINIPEGVTSIGEGAFSSCNRLTAITIPEGVTSIGNDAFFFCSNLTSITIPEGVTSIGSDAFCGCSSLTAITIPASVTSIGEGAFNWCSSLTTITIPKGVTSIGESAFRKCTSLKEIIFEDGSEALTLEYNYYSSSGTTGEGLFYDCPLETIYLGRSLSYNGGSKYGYSPFYNQDKLTSVIIGDCVTSIGEDAFSGCSGLTSITIPESVTSIGAWAFSGCTSLTAITLPEGVTSIGNQAFAFCSSLTAITLPEGVTSIGAYAFSGCTSLTAITLPEGVTSIGAYAFSGCTSLTAVHISSIEAWCKITFEDFASNPFNYAHNLYLNGELVTNLVIPEGVTSIGDYAFSACSGLTAITIPEGVTSIGYAAFEDCSSLTAVHISSIEAWCKITFENYNSNPLYYAHNLYLNGELVTNLVIPEGVTSIGSAAFAYCTSLTSITLPEGVTRIGASAFHSCTSLTSITLPEGVTSIGNSAFYNCSSLTSITIPENSQLTSIGSSAFSGCSSLTAITIPEGVTSIGNSAFYNCSSLRRVTLNCPNVGNHFSSLVAIEEVVFGNSVISIEDNAFSDCSGITSIVIPESVTSVGSNAFSGCSGLKSLFVGTNVDTYGENVFKGCTAVEELAVMGSVMPMVPSDKFTTIRMFSPGPLDTEEFDAKVYRTATLYVPEGSLARYQMADVWKKFWYIEEFDPNESFNVTLDRTTVTMTEGDVITLVATIKPQYIKTVAWSSSDTSVATVDEQGMVTAVAAGTATITAKAGDKEATCVVNVLETRYVITYLVDGEVSATDTLTCGEAITLLEPTKEGYTFSGWSYVPETYPDVTSPMKIDIAGNADAMLYTNAPCTNTSYGDQFVGWHVLFDGDANTFFHSEYSEIESADGLDHYLRVDLGEGNELSFFSFTYTTRGNNTTCNPTEIIVEGANEEDGTYSTIAVLDNLPLGRGESYFSDELGNGIAYRYIRFRVTETNYNYKVCGHPYFYFAEFGMTRYAIKVHDDIMETLVMPDRDVTFVGDFSINKYLVTFKIGDEVIAADSLEYGAPIVVPEAPEKDDHTFNGWGEVAETVPAHDVTYEGSYTGNSYLLTYIVDGDTVQADSVAYGTAIILLDEPVKEGYTFSGWSEAPDTMPAEDVTISGMFTVNIYKVYYYVGEELIHTAEVPYGEAIPEYIYEPTKEDEIFEGWIGETYATMPAHDVTYVANITNDVLQLIIDNSQLTIYDLMGRKVENAENLKGGVYIINGRKVVIGD